MIPLPMAICAKCAALYVVTNHDSAKPYYCIPCLSKAGFIYMTYDGWKPKGVGA